MNGGIHITYQQEASECDASCDHCPWYVKMGQDGIRSEEDVRQAGIDHVKKNGSHLVHMYRGNHISIKNEEEE